MDGKMSQSAGGSRTFSSRCRHSARHRCFSRRQGRDPFPDALADSTLLSSAVVLVSLGDGQARVYLRLARSMPSSTHISIARWFGRSVVVQPGPGFSEVCTLINHSLRSTDSPVIHDFIRIYPLSLYARHCTSPDLLCDPAATKRTRRHS